MCQPLHYSEYQKHSKQYQTIGQPLTHQEGSLNFNAGVHTPLTKNWARFFFFKNFVVFMIRLCIHIREMGKIPFF